MLPRRTGTRSAAECSWPWKRSFCSSRQDKNGTVSCRGPPATRLLTGFVFESAPFDLGHAPGLDTGAGGGFHAPPVWVERHAASGGGSGTVELAAQISSHWHFALTSLRHSRLCPGSCGSGMPSSRCPPYKAKIPLLAQGGHNNAENCNLSARPRVDNPHPRLDRSPRNPHPPWNTSPWPRRWAAVVLPGRPLGLGHGSGYFGGRERFHDARSEALPDHGAHHRLGLQLVVAVYAFGDTGKARRGHHQPPAIVECRG